MSSYSEFIEDAIQNYQKLPQETSELYKRYYINIPFDLNLIAAGGENKGIGKELANVNVKFDVSLGSGVFSVVGNSEFVKIESAERLGKDFIEGGMHKNNEDKYVAYINARSKNCVLIDVPSNKSANINILMMCSGEPLNSIIRIKLGDNSKLNLFEYYGSDQSERSVIGTMHEVKAGNGSEVELSSLQNTNDKTVVLSYFKDSIGEDSHLKLNSLYIGSTHTRVRNTVEANGSRSKVEVNEIIFGSSDQKFDVGTFVINTGAHTSASLESKAALMDTSFCIMKGFAKVNKGASKAKSYVHERGILLNKGARVNGLPDMSVDENDVKATHSSATAPVDEESVFYLMSKGIDEVGVRKLLVTGFFVNSLSKMNSNIMKELSMSLINSKLESKVYGFAPKMEMKNIWIAGTDSQDSDIFKGHYKYRGV